MGVFEVFKPASEDRRQLNDDAVQTAASCTTGELPDLIP